MLEFENFHVKFYAFCHFVVNLVNVVYALLEVGKLC